MVILGIDPGKDGGFAILEDGIVIKTMATPNIKDKNNNGIVDCLKVSEFLSENTIDEIIIEDVHAIFGSSAKTTFNFGRNVGMVESLILAYGYGLVKIKPKDWQLRPWRKVPIIKDSKGKKDNKARSLKALQIIYPNLDYKMLLRTPRCKVAHDGIVDAILIAYSKCS
jgi:hypothetical protein